MLAPFLSHARIQCNINQVSQKVGSQHRHSDNQKDALQQGVVRVLDCLQQGKADAGIRENNFGEQCTSDDEAEGEDEESLTL